ncbi:hypothetical protein C9F11_46140 (plasmid) [Streptomyces sp. YIM 121038]|nr:hypothetical protein C9F11_46140 [Streptomyces sp. YIM 121038]
MVEPGRPTRQPRMQSVPRLRGRLPVEPGVGDGHHLLGVPGSGVAEDELAPVLGRTAWPTHSWWCRAPHDAVGAETAEDLDGQAAQQMGDAGCVVAGVQDDQDLRVTRLPLAGGHEPFDDLAELDRGHCSDVSAGLQTDRVKHCRPGRAAGLQRGDERVGPARDHLVLAFPAAEGVAEGPVSAGTGARPQPRRDVRGQDDPAVRRLRQRHPGQRATQSGDIDPPLVQATVKGTVPAAVFRCECEIDQRPHWPVRAQQRITQLEHGVAPRGQRCVQLRPEA